MDTMMKTHSDEKKSMTSISNVLLLFFILFKPLTPSPRPSCPQPSTFICRQSLLPDYLQVFVIIIIIIIFIIIITLAYVITAGQKSPRTSCIDFLSDV
ncbi:hypothetical protein E2C01_082139 [Portunus trituberculatus]|uniref:Uncharacterized protein n=1 Tax=Portunus trituberculatus TaxID=210409 RepID=A0A5B7IP63_PORTR|nr:hypothetical protein [Portunus trituberculatus]